MTITGRQIHEARALLRWRREGLASRTALPFSVINRAEASDGSVNITMAQEIAIKHAFVTAGVEFIPEGPRLPKSDVWAADYDGPG